MVFVAVVLGLLGVLMVVGVVVVTAKLGALADELREARQNDAHQLGMQLDAIADKLQGTRLDLSAQRRSIEGFAAQLDGPPSMRRPPMSGGTS